MLINNSLIDAYYKWLRDRTVINNLSNGWTEVATPFMDRHNDDIVVYVKKDDDIITISDDGYIINDLSSDGISFKSNNRRKILKDFLSDYGVTNNNGELIVTATIDTFPQKKHMLLQAMLAVSDMFMQMPSNTSPLFIQNVADFFDKNLLLNTPNVCLTGKTGFNYKVDFIIPASKKQNKPERMIKAVNVPRNDTIERTLFMWNDIKTTRHTETGLFVFLNDEKPINNNIIAALKQYQATPVIWTNRNDFIDELSVA